jgi:hypothetical protein
MKKLAILLLIFTPRLMSGQISNNPKIFLNSQIISFDSVFIYEKNIESISVEKDSEGGKLFIKSKDAVWKYRTIDELLKTFFHSEMIFDKAISPIFYIDGKLMAKKSDAKIDYSYFAYVTVKKLSDIKSICKKCRKIVIVEIGLTSVYPEPAIHIRGKTIQEMEDYYKIKK